MPNGTYERIKKIYHTHLVEGKSLPGFVMAPIGEGGMERWEVTSKGPGGPKVCLHCYQPGHIRKQCRNQAPTMAEVVEGKAGGAISYAQVLAGTKAAKPVVPPPPPRQGCAGRSFFQRAGAGRGQKSAGRGEGKIPRGGAGQKNA